MGSAFALTPHKVSICVLLQTYALPSQTPSSLPYPFSSVSHHNRLGIYLLALTKSYEDVLEPKLEQLVNQLREISGSLGDWLTDHLSSRLSSLSSPDDLFNFFTEMRGVLGGSDSSVIEDNQVILDPNSSLGIFLRRCILAFNLLNFEGVCHLLTSIGVYCKEALSSCLPYEFRSSNVMVNELEPLPEYENMELEMFVFGRVSEEVEVRKQDSERTPFHFHAPTALSGFIDGADIQVASDKRARPSNKGKEGSVPLYPPGNALRDVDSCGELFLRTSSQVQGYLMDQADTLEKHESSFFMNTLEAILRQIKKLAPELHRVDFLRYLNSLYHEDYFAALENLHRYFDHSAGADGFDFNPSSSGSNSPERYETALLCLGMMHYHVGHPREALEVLTEAVRFSQQQNNDSCLAYILAVICNLWSEFGGSCVSGIRGTSLLTNMGTSFSVEQQLFVLLKESLKRAQTLKLWQLVAANHLSMARFHLMHVQRPLLSFGPKASTKIKTCPINVCKELRLCSHVISEFSSESSTMTIDGAFSTAWLNNLSKPMGSVLLSHGSGFESDSNCFHFSMQPSSIPRPVLHLVGSSYLLRASAWQTYGSTALARMNSLIYATCFADASSSSDAALVHAKLIQHLAVFHGYKEAFCALKIAEEKFLSISRSVILPLKLQLLHERALHRGHLKLAQRICDELGVLASPVSGVDMKLKAEASLRQARTLLAAKQFNQAAAVAHSLFCMCYKFNMQVENATVLLLLAEIHKKSGNANMGLPYALASLSFCQSLNLDLLKASATITLSELLLSLGPNHARRALHLVHSVLPIVLGHGGLELCARARMAEAKCYLAEPSFSVREDSEAVLDPLRQAADELQVLEYHEMAAEAFYLMAITFDKLGLLEKREEASALFKKHIMALENPEDVDDPLSNAL